MKRPVVWTTQALDELLSISRYIAVDNPDAAQMVSARLRTAATKLGELPTGRPGRVTGTHEKLAPGLPYVLAYEIANAPDAAPPKTPRITAPIGCIRQASLVDTSG